MVFGCFHSFSRYLMKIETQRCQTSLFRIIFFSSLPLNVLKFVLMRFEMLGMMFNVQSSLLKLRTPKSVSADSILEVISIFTQFSSVHFLFFSFAVEKIKIHIHFSHLIVIFFVFFLLFIR